MAVYLASRKGEPSSFFQGWAPTNRTEICCKSERGVGGGGFGSKKVCRSQFQDQERHNGSSSWSGVLCDKDTGSVAYLHLSTLRSNTTGTFGRVIKSASISQLVAVTLCILSLCLECMLPLFWQTGHSTVGAWGGKDKVLLWAIVGDWSISNMSPKHRRRWIW